MEQSVNPVDVLQYIPQPAFLVKEGMIINTNHAAQKFQITLGTQVKGIITQGAEDYAAFHSGKMYLQLICGPAWVSAYDQCHLFCMEESYSSPELRAFALAAQHLRMPLSSAVSNMELIAENKIIHQDPQLQQQLGQLNRSLYQMIREICNMSDVSQLGAAYNTKLAVQNVTAVFEEYFEKAASYSLEHGHTLNFKNLKQYVESAIDRQLLERAVLNLISNAVKFSPKGSEIRATLKKSENRLILTVENSLSANQFGLAENTFSRFLREPGIDTSEAGIGLGMSIISRAISAHSGTVLLNTTRRKSAKVTIAIPIRTNIEQHVESPTLLLGSYTGGFDSYLIELSEILPSCYYEASSLSPDQ